MSSLYRTDSDILALLRTQAGLTYSWLPLSREQHCSQHIGHTHILHTVITVEPSDSYRIVYNLESCFENYCSHYIEYPSTSH